MRVEGRGAGGQMLVEVQSVKGEGRVGYFLLGCICIYVKLNFLTLLGRFHTCNSFAPVQIK